MNILENIVATKVEEIALLKKKKNCSDFINEELFHHTCVSLHHSLHQQRFAIIAEIKRASPSAGIFRKEIVPEEIATIYSENGATGISVLTDEKYFNGSLHDLKKARAVVSLPLLRKDFILDEIQIYEAKAYGADAILLIAKILEKNQIEDLFFCTRELGMEALIELYDENEIENLDFGNMKLIGVNNRNLETFQIDIRRTVQMSKYIPTDCCVVSESGIASADDVRFLAEHNIHAALVGEHLMRSEHPGETLKKLVSIF